MKIDYSQFNYCLVYGCNANLNKKLNDYLQDATKYLDTRFSGKYERKEFKIYTNDLDTALWCKIMYPDYLKRVESKTAIKLISL